MDIKTQWKKMAEKAVKQELHFMIDNARMNNQKKEEQLEKQYDYMKNVNLNICSCIDKYAGHPTM